MEHRSRIGVPVHAKSILLGGWVERWLTISLPASPDSLSYRTQMTFLARKHIIPSPMAALPFQQVTPAVIEDFINTLRTLGTEGHGVTKTGKPPADSTIRSVYMTQRRALDVAVRDGQITANPLHVVKAPKVAPRSVEVYSPDEVQRLLTALQPSCYFPYFALISTTGVRRGEALGLKWDEPQRRWRGRPAPHPRATRAAVPVRRGTAASPERARPGSPLGRSRHD